MNLLGDSLLRRGSILVVLLLFTFPFCSTAAAASPSAPPSAVLEGYEDVTELQTASLHGLLDEVKRVLTELEADKKKLHEVINYRNKKELMTAFHAAVFNNHYEVAKLLVIYGADVTIGDKTGVRPIHVAAKANNVEILQLLLAHPLVKGSDHLNVQDDRGLTPLHFAAYSGALEAITLLLNVGAKISVGDVKGFTPLFHACYDYQNSYKNKSKTLSLLLTHGANPKILEKKGISPIDIMLLSALFPVSPTGEPLTVDMEERLSRENLKELYMMTKLLLEAGSDPNVVMPGDQITPIWRIFASTNHLVDIAMLLVMYGADIGFKMTHVNGQQVSIWDILESNEDEGLPELPYIRFAYKPLKEWTHADIYYWFEILSDQCEATKILKEVKPVLDNFRKIVSREGLKGSYFFKTELKDIKKKFNSDNAAFRSLFYLQLDELRANRRHKRAFPVFWEVTWFKKSKPDLQKKLWDLDPTLF